MHVIGEPHVRNVPGTPFTSEDAARLRAATDALVATVGESGYDEEVAAWNSAIGLRAAIVVGARTPDDVAAAVRWAADLGLPIGVNSTGHGAVANADGALLITTRRMSEVTVDPATKTATVAAGARVRDVATAAAQHGLAWVQGSTGSVSAAGFMLGGGLGVMSRSFGLATDLVVSIDVVTADGELHTVDADHNPELWWALRGAKGNLGVITSFVTRLVDASTFYGGGIFFDGDHASAVLPAYRQWISQHTDNTSSSVALLRLPPDPALPEPIRGRFVVHVRMAHTGDQVEGARLAGDIRAAAPVLLEHIAELPMTELDRVHQDPPGPMPFYHRGGLLDGLPDEALDAILEIAELPESPLVITEIRQLGGAVAGVGPATDAVPGRAAAYLLSVISPDVPPLAETGPAAVHALFDAVGPWLSAENLPNFLGRRSAPTEVCAAWPSASGSRLLQVKQKWDPRNLFRVGHGLLPEPDPSRSGGAPSMPLVST